MIRLGRKLKKQKVNAEVLKVQWTLFGILKVNRNVFSLQCIVCECECECVYLISSGTLLQLSSA